MGYLECLVTWSCATFAKVQCTCSGYIIRLALCRSARNEISA